MPTTELQLFAAVVAAPKEDSNDLLLRIAPQQGAYLVGEPILLRCFIFNGTRAELTVPYELWGTNSKMEFRVRAPDGRHVGWLEVLSAPLTMGHTIFTIPPQHQLAVTVDLRHDFAMSAPGVYHANIEFRSDGRILEPDKARPGRLTTKKGWAGRLTVDVGNIEIQEPSHPDDKDALNTLLKGIESYYGKQRPLGVMMLYYDDATETVRRQVLNDFPNSRYAPYIRYYLAESILSKAILRSRFQDAKAAVAMLERVDRDRIQRLFAEMVLHRLIHAHVVTGSDASVVAPLVQEFRKQFPHSPYVLPTLSP